MEQSEKRIQTGCLLILTTIAIAAALNLFSVVLIPFVLAIFLTYCLAPVIDLQTKLLKFPRPLAIITTVLVGCLILFLVALLISGALGQVAANSDEYLDQISRWFHQVTSSARMQWFGLDTEELSAKLFEIAGNTAKTILAATVSSIMTVVSNGLLVVIFMIFMITGKTRHRPPATSVWFQVEKRIKRYVLTMAMTSGVTGVLVGLTLTILGVDFAWMFGFLAFLLNFIPNIGSIIATLLPLPVAMLSPELSVPAKIMVIAIPGAIQFVIGNIVAPKLMGQSMDLHPVAVLLSLIFFGAIWGIVGMFLATPITAVIKMLLERFDYTKPVANLLAGKINGHTHQTT